MGNWFHTMWLDAEEEKNNFNTIKLHWTVHPERDQAWRDEQDKDLGERLASQECDTDFLASGNNVVNPFIVQWYKNEYMEDPLDKRSVDKGLWVWKHPEPGKSYVIAADVARGDGSDYSAAHVFDPETLEQIAEYRGAIGTRDYGRLLAALGIEYNGALIVVERENVGWDTIQELIDIGYPNLFYSSNDLQYVDTLKQINNKINRSEKKMKPGFATTHRNRGLVIAKIEQYFEEKSVVVKSVRLLNELETFIWNHGKAEAQSGRNDDLVMALGILLWVRDTALKLRAQGIELTKMALDRIKKSDGLSGVWMGSNPDLKRDPYILDNGRDSINLREFL